MNWNINFITEQGFRFHVANTISLYRNNLHLTDIEKFDHHNNIGYFHQRIFQYINGCHVPDNETEGGWDVIYENPDGIALPDGDIVHTVYVKMVNKYVNTNSPTSVGNFIIMQDRLLHDKDCACFLVEATSPKPQNIKWTVTIDGQKYAHNRIRRVSMDNFYALVTGVDDAFYQICIALPEVIHSVVAENEQITKN